MAVRGANPTRGSCGLRRASRDSRVLAVLATGASCAHAELLLKGVSYGPTPLKTQEGASSLPQDDWMADDAAQMWGPAGRFDLRVIRSHGANMVRLYGNNPDNDHTNFLDTAWGEGLRVAAGMSDYAYYQMHPGSCQSTDFDCFSQVKPLYQKNLQTGFLTPDRTYHPALLYMNILNEPDLKMPAGAVNNGPEGPIKMCRAILSAMDAMLDAEREANVAGPLLNFTATFSYAICSSCEFSGSHPALGQIMQLDDAMRNPGKYGYAPRNDVFEAYRTRYTHSFNTANPASDLEGQLLNAYFAQLPGTPVYIGEYHHVFGDYHPGVPDQASDLAAVLDIAGRHSLFLGVSFFQYQVAYWKGGSETEFGMFGLTGDPVATMSYFGRPYPLYCLAKEADRSAAGPATVPDAVAKVYGGAGVGDEAVCGVGAGAATPDQEGYEAVRATGDAAKMAAFVRRVVTHLGATADAAAGGLWAFADRYAAGGRSFADMASELAGAPPGWLRVDAGARCVADRAAPPSAVGPAIAWVCAHAKTFACDDIPEDCKGSVYKTADFVLSRYYLELGDVADPLTDCYARGAGIFEASETFLRRGDLGRCVSSAAGMAVAAPPAVVARWPAPWTPPPTRPPQQASSTTEALAAPRGRAPPPPPVQVEAPEGMTGGAAEDTSGQAAQRSEDYMDLSAARRAVSPLRVAGRFSGALAAPAVALAAWAVAGPLPGARC